MSEQQQYQGDRWTTQSQSILENLGWIQKGDSNFDIPCTNKSNHATGQSKERKNPHGIDLLFSYYDPFLRKDTGIIVESKHRKWSGISTSTIQDFIDQLTMTIECASLDSKIQDLGCDNVRTGLLMLWCNEPSLFDNSEFKKYLSEIDLKKRKNPITLYIASNNEILKWCSIIEKVKEYRGIYEDFKVFYTSDSYSGGLSSATRKDYLTLKQLYSSYIFAKGKKNKRVSKDTVTTIDSHHVFFFATPTTDELNFMFSYMKRFQFEDADELIIHFYGEQVEYREYISQFIRNKKKAYEKEDSHLDLKVDYLNRLQDVPENYSQRWGSN